MLSSRTNDSRDNNMMIEDRKPLGLSFLGEDLNPCPFAEEPDGNVTPFSINRFSAATASSFMARVVAIHCKAYKHLIQCRAFSAWFLSASAIYSALCCFSLLVNLNISFFACFTGTELLGQDAPRQRSVPSIPSLFTSSQQLRGSRVQRSTPKMKPSGCRCRSRLLLPSKWVAVVLAQHFVTGSSRGRAAGNSSLHCKGEQGLLPSQELAEPSPAHGLTFGLG